jgi:NADPH-dependent ferric siderophore reductase
VESAHDDDRDIPIVRDTDVVWVDRDDGDALVEAVSSSAFDASDHFGWVACDNRTTRAVSKMLREEYRIPRKSIKAQAYWARDRSMKRSRRARQNTPLVYSGA